MNELLLQKIADPYVKLKMIYERTIELIDHYHPDEMALEAPFSVKMYSLCSSSEGPKGWPWRPD